MKNISTSPIPFSNYYLKSGDIDISNLNINNNEELIFNVIGFYNDFSDKLPKLYKPKESIQRVVEFNLEENVYFKFEDNNIFKFEYKHSNNEKQFLLFWFNNTEYLEVYLTELNGDSKEFQLHWLLISFNEENAYLTNSGIY